MSFSFTDEQEQFRDIVARFCRDKSPTTKVRECMATDRGYDDDVWRQLCQELGLVGIHISEDKGGAGFGAVELGIVMEEFGRSLMSAPYFASAVLAATAIAEVASPTQRDQWLPNLLSGEKIAALAISETSGQFSLDGLHTEATVKNGQTVLNGSKHFVVDGQNADILIVAANDEHGASLYFADSKVPGINLQPSTTMDTTRKLAEIQFSDVPAERLGHAHTSVDITPIYNTALIALANEMVGGAQALLDSAIEYTRLRVQFGRTIGSFQAIKHRLADLLLDVELAKSAAYQAAQALSGDTGSEGKDVSELASLAKAAASEAYLQAAIQAIQLHGGIGFTWENDTHLWFKRAKSSEVFLGTPNQHRERMLVAMGV